MKKKENSIGIGDIFRGLGDLLEVIQKMDLQGVSEVNKTGRFGSSSPRGLKGAYGFSVRVGELGDSSIRSFGNLKAGSGSVEFDEAWEPILDLFDEGDRILVVAELPGIDEDQLQMEISGECLQLRASGVRRYKKDIMLPCPVDEKNIVSVFKNGIVEITLCKLPE